MNKLTHASLKKEKCCCFKNKEVVVLRSKGFFCVASPACVCVCVCSGPLLWQISGKW